MEQHTFALTIRKTEDIYVQISASSPERALQLATNYAGGDRSVHVNITGTKTTTTPVMSSVRAVPR